MSYGFLAVANSLCYYPSIKKQHIEGIMLRKEPSQQAPLESIETTPIQALNQTFNFDWNACVTVHPSEAELQTLENKLNEMVFSESQSHLSSSDKEALGQLFFKLGVFYTHAMQQHQKAIEKLKCVKHYSNDVTLLAWALNHIAFANQRIAADGLKKQPRGDSSGPHPSYEYYLETLNYCNEVTNQHKAKTDPESLKIVVFASLVESLTRYDNNEFSRATKCFHSAFELNQKHRLMDETKGPYAQLLKEASQRPEKKQTHSDNVLSMFYHVNLGATTYVKNRPPLIRKNST